MNAKTANPGANASASDPRRAPRDGAGRTHSRRKAFAYCVFVAILLGGGFALHERAERRAEARDRELVDLVNGTLLPGSEAVRRAWNFAPGSDEYGTDWSVDGETVLEPGAGPTAHLIRVSHAALELTNSFWVIRTGTPTESRFFDLLRSLRETGLLVPAGPHSSFAFRQASWQCLPPGVLTDSERNDVVFVSEEMDNASRRTFFERISSFLEAEAARDDVVFREEEPNRLVIGFGLYEQDRIEEPGRFRRALSRVCGALSLPLLRPVSEWAGRLRYVPDPYESVGCRQIQLVLGAPEHGRRRLDGWTLSEPGPDRPGEFVIADGTPLADAIRSLCDARKPWTFPGSVPAGSENVLASLSIWGSTEERERSVYFDRMTPQLRDFMIDLFRLLADPATNAPAAEKSHAESAESAE